MQTGPPPTCQVNPSSLLLLGLWVMDRSGRGAASGHSCPGTALPPTASQSPEQPQDPHPGAVVGACQHCLQPTHLHRRIVLVKHLSASERARGTAVDKHCEQGSVERLGVRRHAPLPASARWPRLPSGQHRTWRAADDAAWFPLAPPHTDTLSPTHVHRRTWGQERSRINQLKPKLGKLGMGIPFLLVPHVCGKQVCRPVSACECCFDMEPVFPACM